MSIQLQLIWLFVLAIPVACIAWTVTHEEVFREPREFCIKCSKEGTSIFMRKFFYLFTCEYCFSHYVTVLFVVLTDFKLLMDDWRGYLIGGFALVWIANVYMSLFARVRIDLKRERTEVSVLEKQEKQQDYAIDNEPTEMVVGSKPYSGTQSRNTGRKMKRRFHSQQPPAPESKS
ncbi:hypothetical protein WBG78_02810 [Chryseolinea sp. T2]|uniref:hypothetical protein n=1 Tax=Chryseolinea sp. T2 TaxID=3129255 RepID=UPI003077A1B0